MSDFAFEYTDTKFTLRLLGWSFLIFVVLLIAMAVTVKLIGIIGSIILAFGVPLLIFLLNKKKIKKQGAASIHDSYSEFTLTGSTERVVYADIKTYQVERYKGVHLRIKFKNGKDFKLQANSNFCNTGSLDFFCQAFESVIEHYKTNNNIELIRKPSMFEQAWMLPLLIVLTGGLIGGIIFAISTGRSIPPIFYTSAAFTIPLWIGYLSARKKKQEQGVD